MKMNKVQYSLIVSLGILSGFLGGMVSGYLFSNSLVSAQVSPEGSKPSGEARTRAKTEQLKKELLQLMADSEKQSEDRKNKKKEYEKSLTILKAQGFELVDKQGKTRAKLITDYDGNPYLNLRRDKELLSIGFGSVTNGPELTMMKYSASGFATAIVSLESIGVNNGKQSVSLSVKPDEAASMWLMGSKGSITLDTGEEDSPHLAVSNNAREVVWVAP